MTELNSLRRDAASGTATSVVIFVHGYGANGADLFGLADPLAPHFPDTVFYAPDAPQPCAGSPMGFQWFPIPWLDGSSETAMRDGFDSAVKTFNGFLDKVLEDEGLPPEALALVGFSQGTMMSLEVAYRRPAPFACVAGFSGRLIDPERLETELTVRPPLLLLHGDQDPVVAPSSMPEAAKAMQAAGVAVETHVMPGTPHGISPDGLSRAAGFLKAHLPG